MYCIGNMHICIYKYMYFIYIYVYINVYIHTHCLYTLYQYFHTEDRPKLLQSTFYKRTFKFLTGLLVIFSSWKKKKRWSNQVPYQTCRKRQVQSMIDEIERRICPQNGPLLPAATGNFTVISKFLGQRWKERASQPCLDENKSFMYRHSYFLQRSTQRKGL